MVLADPDWVAADTGGRRAGSEGLAIRPRRLMMHLPEMHLPEMCLPKMCLPKVRLPKVRLPKE